jgi:hypothetical protein
VASDTAHRAPAVLETGWLPTTPIGDTVLRRFIVHHAECVASVAETHGGRVLRRPEVVAADLGRPGGMSNSALLLQPLGVRASASEPAGGDPLGVRASASEPAGGDTVDGTGIVTDVARWYAAGGQGDVLLWSPWPTPDLRAHGWHLVGHPPLLIRQPGGPLPGAATDVTVTEVSDAAGVDEFSRVLVDGFPLDDLRPYRPGVLFDGRLRRDPRWRLWLAAVDGRTVAGGALFVEHDLAQLALAATLPEARGHGAWYALVRARLLAGGDLMSAGIFGDLSRPGIERLGYLPITRFTLWRRDRHI